MYVKPRIILSALTLFFLLAAVCPQSIATETATGQCSAIVNYSIPTLSDNCGPVGTAVRLLSGPSSSSHVSAAFFPTLVTYLGSDASGNTATCTFNITVKDLQPPTFGVLFVNSYLSYAPLLHDFFFQLSL